jgi:hypothetical protein
MKKNVKQYLMQSLGSQFSACVVNTDKGSGIHRTYCVPQHLMDIFKVWAASEMRRLTILNE